MLSLKRGFTLAILAAAVATMALASSASAAVPYCGGATINNANKCWGAARVMSSGEAWGTATGVCVGADQYSGTCAPTGAWAWVSVPLGQHAPWVIGTASAHSKVGEGRTFP
jgi:hypothetical protein